MRLVASLLTAPFGRVSLRNRVRMRVNDYDRGICARRCLGVARISRAALTGRHQNVSFIPPNIPKGAPGE